MGHSAKIQTTINMKNTNKIICAFVLALSLCACRKGDSEVDLGFPKIYIPQATITGLDNTYPIPNGSLTQNSKYVCRYDKAAGTLEVNIGVVRAGFIKDAKAFSVDLGVCEEQTQKKLESYAASGVLATMLPLSVCDIPPKISVESGKNSGTVYLSIDMKELSKQRDSFFAGDSYKILVLGLEISNPTAYELADSNTNVVICLDLNSEEWDKAESPVRTLFPIY